MSRMRGVIPPFTATKTSLLFLLSFRPLCPSSSASAARERVALQPRFSSTASHSTDPLLLSGLAKVFSDQ